MAIPLRIAIHGASGRNGRRLVALVQADDQLRLAGAIVRPLSKHLGADTGLLAGIAPTGIFVTSEFPKSVDAVIDFSSPEGSQNALMHCRLHRIPLVVASTGLTSEQVENIRLASSDIPICYAPNMSVAVNLTMKLAERAATALRDVPGGADVEIIERHHRFKEDSPSGTALRFGQIVANAMGLTHHIHGRVGQVGARSHCEVGYHAVRTGDDAGQHTIVFGMLGETIELRVAASNRDCYATGAIAAAKFLANQPAGLYSMFDVLGI